VAREYRSSDLEAVRSLSQRSVHEIANRDYRSESGCSLIDEFALPAASQLSTRSDVMSKELLDVRVAKPDAL
jgi:hypothetical protein